MSISAMHYLCDSGGAIFIWKQVRYGVVRKDGGGSIVKAPTRFCIVWWVGNKFQGMIVLSDNFRQRRLVKVQHLFFSFSLPIQGEYNLFSLLPIVSDDKAGQLRVFSIQTTIKSIKSIK